MAHVIKEVYGVPGITQKNATTKHAQTIGLLEWCVNQTSIEDWGRRTEIVVK